VTNLKHANQTDSWLWAVEDISLGIYPRKRKDNEMAEKQESISQKLFSGAAEC
jgi:hypothetical protein